MTRIIDSHCHIYPEKIALRAVDAVEEFYEGLPREPWDGTAAQLMTSGREAEISHFVVFTVATTPHQVSGINRFIAQSVRESGGCMTGLGAMHPDSVDFARDLDEAVALGLKGVKLHPDIQGFAMDDERLMPMYRALNDLDMFLISHNGDYRYDYSHPRRMARLAKMFPDMRFIGAHFGGWSQWREARECLQLPNVYVDTSSTLGFADSEAAVKGFETFDHSHIFFGSDYPMWEPGIELDRLLSLKLDDRLLSMVLWENFENFLRL